MTSVPLSSRANPDVIAQEAISVLSHGPSLLANRSPSTVTFRVFDSQGKGSSSASNNADTRVAYDAIGDVTISTEDLKLNEPVTLKLHVRALLLS